jgi:anti-anti-sigma factor
MESAMNDAGEHIQSPHVIMAPETMLGGPDALSFNDAIRELSKEHKHIVIDCSQVSLMNSSGLGMLISAQATMKQVGGQCSLRNITEQVNKLLEMTRLKALFEIT